MTTTLIAAFFAFYGASSSLPKPALKPPTAIAPCQVVAHQEVQQAFKRMFAKGTEDANSCEYTAIGDQTVAIKMQHSARKLDVQAEMLTLRKAFPEARMRDAAGLGTAAFFLDLPGIGTQLFVIRGDHDFLLVSVMGLGEAKKISNPTRQIAKLALDRLPTVQ